MKIVEEACRNFRRNFSGMFRGMFRGNFRGTFHELVGILGYCRFLYGAIKSNKNEKFVLRKLFVPSRQKQKIV